MFAQRVCYVLCVINARAFGMYIKSATTEKGKTSTIIHIACLVIIKLEYVSLVCIACVLFYE